MVQANQFCGKAHEDASAHLKHFLRFAAHSLYQKSQRRHTTSPLPILTVGESEVVVLRKGGEEYYMDTLLHELSGQVLSHGKDQCSPWEDYKFSATT